MKKTYVFSGLLFVALLAQNAQVLPFWGSVQARFGNYFGSNITTKVSRIMCNCVHDYVQTRTDVKRLQMSMPTFNFKFGTAALYFAKNSNSWLRWNK